jgi:hypothetical protein
MTAGWVPNQIGETIAAQQQNIVWLQRCALVVLSLARSLTFEKVQTEIRFRWNIRAKIAPDNMHVGMIARQFRRQDALIQGFLHP